MQMIRHPNDVRLVRHAGIQSLIGERFAMLEEYGPYDPDELGWFLVIESGDQPLQCERWPCPPLLQDEDGLPVDHPDFCSPYEFCIRHDTGIFELVRVLSDGGEAVAIFIPDQPDISTDLIHLCRTLSAQS